MTSPVPMCLVFRLGGIGFAMPIEVVEEVHTDGPDNDSAELDYRGGRIPRFDLASRFGVALPSNAGTAPVVILRWEGMPQAISVDKVEGVFPGELFELHQLPPLLSLPANLPYRQLLLWQGQPLVYCDPLCLAAQVEGL